jgi:hypothetical protein
MAGKQTQRKRRRKEGKDRGNPTIGADGWWLYCWAPKPEGTKNEKYLERDALRITASHMSLASLTQAHLLQRTQEDSSFSAAHIICWTLLLVAGQLPEGVGSPLSPPEEPGATKTLAGEGLADVGEPAGQVSFFLEALVVRNWCCSDNVRHATSCFVCTYHSSYRNVRSVINVRLCHQWRALVKG